MARDQLIRHVVEVAADDLRLRADAQMRSAGRIVIRRLGRKEADYAFGSNPPYALSSVSTATLHIVAAPPAATRRPEDMPMRRSASRAVS